MITTVDGDAVHALREGSIDVLGHQVNLDGVMGAGIARQIARAWPAIVPAYRHALATQALTLGRMQTFEVAPGRWIANLAGQQHPRRRGRATDYPALQAALITYADWTHAHQLRAGLPYGLGCGLAGGDWATVSALIATAFHASSVTLFRWAR